MVHVDRGGQRLAPEAVGSVLAEVVALARFDDRHLAARDPVEQGEHGGPSHPIGPARRVVRPRRRVGDCGPLGVDGPRRRRGSTARSEVRSTGAADGDDARTRSRAVERDSSGLLMRGLLLRRRSARSRRAGDVGDDRDALAPQPKGMEVDGGGDPPGQQRVAQWDGEGAAPVEVDPAQREVGLEDRAVALAVLEADARGRRRGRCNRSR